MTKRHWVVLILHHGHQKRHQTWEWRAPCLRHLPHHLGPDIMTPMYQGPAPLSCQVAPWWTKLLVAWSQRSHLRSNPPECPLWGRTSSSRMDVSLLFFKGCAKRQTFCCGNRTNELLLKWFINIFSIILQQMTCGSMYESHLLCMLSTTFLQTNHEKPFKRNR